MKKRLVILGAGESGTGAAILAQKMGYEVFVSDGGKMNPKSKQLLQDYNIAFEEEGHSVEKIINASEIVKSPGIFSTSPIIQKCIEKGIPIIDELEFAFRYKGNSKIISVTGSNGKTTTVSLIYHIIKSQTEDVALVGNIGNSFAKQIATDPKSIYVVEVSSFQLDYIQQYNSDVSILLNITPDHLNVYDYDMEKYIASKFRIIKNSTNDNYFIYCKDDQNIITYIDKYSKPNQKIPFTNMNQEISTGAYVTNEEIHIKIDHDTMHIPLSDVPLVGKHNQYNTMAAAIATKAIHIRKEVIQKAIQSFQAVDHRMEYLGTFGGVIFINDSKATNINSTWYALESMEKPTVLILGGQDKGNDYRDIEELVKQKVKAIVCLGVNNEKIIEFFTGKVDKITETKSMDDAVKVAFSLASQGDTILLSPACASFDLFQNYEDRGRQFKNAIMNL